MVMEAQDTEIMPGYKLTELGVIPEDWKPKPLGLLSAFITKGATPTTYGFSWVSDGVLFLRSECVSEQGLDLTQSMFITPEAHNILKRGEVHAGDILITITGNVGRVIYLNPDFEVANINQHIARIRIVDDNVVANYIFHFLSQATVRKYYGSITTGQAYPQISLKQVRDTRVPIPPLPEQHAIATALSDVDALITSLDKLISKKRDIKQATMQQLLTGKTRLPGFSGEWHSRLLSEICWFQEGPGVRNTQFTRSGIKLLNGTNIYKGEVDLESTDRFISEKEAFGPYAHFLVDHGDILIACSGITVDKFHEKVAFAKKEHLPLCMNTSTMRFKPFKNYLLANFLYQLLMSDVFKKQIGLQATGSAQLNFGPSHVANIVFALPELKEQTTIAVVLTDMDAEIAALEQKREKTRMLKQGMMQELLTGKIRLV